MLTPQQPYCNTITTSYKSVIKALSQPKRTNIFVSGRSPCWRIAGRYADISQLTSRRPQTHVFVPKNAKYRLKYPAAVHFWCYIPNFASQSLYLKRLLPVYACFIMALLLLSGHTAQGQLPVRGTVLDIGRINGVQGVVVSTNNGRKTQTDTLGRYMIDVAISDSLYFTYNNKSTLRYAVKDIADFTRFDIALQMSIPSKYKALKEVTVFSKSYQQDSVENREQYARYFNYQKPGIKSSVVNGAAGADINELINLFRFRRNKYLKKFQARLLQQEKDRYVDYRFNKKTVYNLTGLTGAAQDTFMIIFRPSYEFAATSQLYDFYDYIKLSGEQYKLGSRENVFMRRWKELVPVEE
jgi:hypothetical protein